MSEATQRPETTAAGKAAKTRAARKGFTRRAAALIAALAIVGFSYAMAGPSSAEEEGSTGSSMSQEELIAAGQEVYNKSCITCHGANLEGVTDRGPALIGVGEAAVYFQVSTGRMPMAQQGAQAPRKPTTLTREDTLALSAYIGQYGGPEIPEITESDLKEADLAEGGELFRLNCASCHSFTAQGGALSSGKHAPDLKKATPVEIYTAMLTGPQNMPVFGQNQLTNEEKMAIVAYVEMLNTDNNPGGAPIGRTGPVPEGLTIWLAGLGVLLIGTVWIAGKS